MAAFYREHGRIVLAQVLLVTGERVLAEEIVQDTMLAVWRGAGSFRGESSVRSWVIAIARRQTRDRLRGRRLRLVDDAFLADQPGPGPGPEATALDRAELAEVTGAIRELARPHREVLGLAFGSGLSLPEVAGVLDIPLGTVKSRLTSARAALNRILDEKGQNR
jgi:RNA polymerase sigma-70 factor, ECF subfamily